MPVRDKPTRPAALAFANGLLLLLPLEVVLGLEAPVAVAEPVALIAPTVKAEPPSPAHSELKAEIAKYWSNSEY